MIGRMIHAERRPFLTRIAAQLALCVLSSLALAQGDLVGWSKIVMVDQESLVGMTAVAAGDGHSLALREDGSIVAWGRNDWGQCNVPEPNTDFVAIAAGGWTSLGLKSDGTVVAWGYYGNGQRDIPLPNADFVSIASGPNVCAGVRPDGTAVLWGGASANPVPNQGIMRIALGPYYYLALRNDGVIYAWGADARSYGNIPAPNLDFIAISMGTYRNQWEQSFCHGLGLKLNGSVVAWGNGAVGQCSVPSPNTGFTAIAAGGGFSLALRQDGSIAAWGTNQYGQCSVPAPNAEFRAVAAGYAHCVGLKSDGSVVTWGRNDYGQCMLPKPNTRFTAVSVGGYGSAFFGLALRTDGAVQVWGSNACGESDIPVPNSGFVAISAGQTHCLGLKDNGSVVAWGAGATPVPEPNTAYAAVAAGSGFSVILKQDGRLVVWGSNTDHQCDVPWPNAGFSQIAAGSRHCLGLRIDGSIAAWGYGGDGQCNVPEPNADFVSIAAGAVHNLALKRDGSIVAWGNNSYGQCNVPPPNEGFTAIAIGDGYSLALRSDGSVAAWGNNYTGACSVPSPNSGFTAIAGGGLGEWSHTVALKGVPFVPTVTDVPGDQGGRLAVLWPAHYKDLNGGSSPIVEYRIQRLSVTWEDVAAVSATSAPLYAQEIVTADVAVAGETPPVSQYRVIACSEDNVMQYPSLQVGGCSVDNLPPPAPNAWMVDNPSFRGLLWDDPATDDLASICIYGSDAHGFVPGEPLDCRMMQLFVATDLPWHFYRVQFVDTHGNRSEFSPELNGQYVADAPEVPVPTLRLYPCQPNPFNPRTTIKYDLPEAGLMRLAVFDLAGRLVRTLVDESLPQGSHEAVWDGRDASGKEVSSGTYLARLEFGGRVETVRMGLVR